MSQVTFAANSRYRVYDLDLPLHIPCFGVGFAISKFKKMGVWSKLPPRCGPRPGTPETNGAA